MCGGSVVSKVEGFGEEEEVPLVGKSEGGLEPVKWPLSEKVQGA